MLRCFATKIIGLVGFEPTACRRGDRSTISSRDHLYLVPFCNIARVALLRSEWQSFPCGLVQCIKRSASRRNPLGRVTPGPLESFGRLVVVGDVAEQFAA